MSSITDVYVYLPDTLADWEIGHLTAELATRQYFKANAPGLSVRTVAATPQPVRTMGGLTVIPDLAVDDIAVGPSSLLVLPGAQTWSEPQHAAVLDVAEALLDVGGTVAAICGATSALAARGVLDHRPHTSNSAAYLQLTAPGYQGRDHCRTERAVSDGNLITAGAAGGLDFARLVLERLDVMDASALESWHRYFATGNAEHFLALMAALPREGSAA